MTTALKPLTRGGILLSALMLSALAAPAARAQLLPTTGPVLSRLGPLELENGYPTDATIVKIFDDIDFQRACQSYLWALPLMAMQQWQSEHLARFGAGKLDYVDYLTFQDKQGLLTANATTPYIMAFPNLRETGPLVFEVPAGPTAGGFTDFWQRPVNQTSPDAAPVSMPAPPERPSAGHRSRLRADPFHRALDAPRHSKNASNRLDAKAARTSS